MGRLEGKVAFLTGAGAGIAKAAALSFVREGAKVAIIELNKETGAAAEKDVRAAGGDAIFIETDVTNDASVKRAVDATVAKFGKLDVLLNCAGGSLQEDVTRARNGSRRVAPHRRAEPAASVPDLPPRDPAHDEGGRRLHHQHDVAPRAHGLDQARVCGDQGRHHRVHQDAAAQYANHGIRANGIAPGSVRTERQIKRYENKEWMMAEKLSPAARAREITKKLYPFASGDPATSPPLRCFSRPTNRAC